MNNFIKGIKTIGELNPDPISISRKTALNAWYSVAHDFYETGRELKESIYEAQQTTTDSSNKEWSHEY